MPLRAIEARAGFVQLVLALKGSGPGALQQAGDLGMGERLERADGFKGLIEDALTIYASDLDRDRQVHTVMESPQWGHVLTCDFYVLIVWSSFAHHRRLARPLR